MFIRAVLGEEERGEVVIERNMMEIDAETAAKIIDSLYESLWKLVENGVLNAQYEELNPAYAEYIYKFRVSHIEIAEFTNFSSAAQTIRTLYIP